MYTDSNTTSKSSSNIPVATLQVSVIVGLLVIARIILLVIGGYYYYYYY